MKWYWWALIVLALVVIGYFVYKSMNKTASVTVAPATGTSGTSQVSVTSTPSGQKQVTVTRQAA